MSATMIDEEREPSVLADFDAGHVLDELSFGIIVLDEQLCAIYANVIAQDWLALRLPSMRGRPLAQFLPRPRRFAWAVQRALKSGTAVDYTLRGPGRWPENADIVNVRITPLWNQISGPYLLVEMSARAGVPFRVSPARAVP